MALEGCRECGGQASTEAESCPHCGARDPASDPGGPARSRPEIDGLLDGTSDQLQRLAEHRREMHNRAFPYARTAAKILLVVSAAGAALWWADSFVPDKAERSSAGEAVEEPAGVRMSSAQRLEVVDHGWRGVESGKPEVGGIVLNRSERAYEFVQVIVEFYDRSGALVGTTLENVAGLEPDEKWRFRAAVPYDGVDSYRIGGVIARGQDAVDGRGQIEGRSDRSILGRTLQQLNPFKQKEALEQRNDSRMRTVRDLTKEGQKRE